MTMQAEGDKERTAMDPVELSSAILRERAGGKGQEAWDAFAHAPQAERWWRSLPRRLGRHRASHGSDALSQGLAEITAYNNQRRGW